MNESKMVVVNKNHPTVMTDVGGGRMVPIDVEIAEVVRLVNKAGFETCGSCQAGSWTGRELAYVSFQHMNDTQRFVRFAYAAGINTEALEIGAWVEGSEIIGEIDFPLEEVPVLVERLRAVLAGAGG